MTSKKIAISGKEKDYKIHTLMGRFLRYWLPSVRKLSPATVETYRATFRSYIAYLESIGIPIASMTTSDFSGKKINDYIAWLIKQKKSKATVNLRIVTFRAFASFAIDEDPSMGDIFSSVMKVKKLRNPSKGLPCHLERNQVTLLLKQPDRTTRQGLKDYTMILIAYKTGARVSELTSIKLRDIIRTESRVLISLTGKGNKTRQIILSKSTVKDLEYYLAKFHSRSDDDTWLFYTNYKEKKSHMTRHAVNCMLRKYARMAHAEDNTFPEKLHAHMLRHSIATHLYRGGLPLTYVRDFLGHNSLGTTSIYTSTDPETIREKLEELDDERAAFENEGKTEKELLLELAGLSSTTNL